MTPKSGPEQILPTNLQPGQAVRLNTDHVSQVDGKTARFMGIWGNYAVVHVEGFNGQMLFSPGEIE